MYSVLVLDFVFYANNTI